jgi:predicted metal-dependent peptidase
MSLSAEIQAARLSLVKERPYLASAAWALQPVQKLGLGTLAVDMYWRLYFDPAVTTKWTVEELSGVLYHEIMHLLRNHSERMQNFDRMTANLATDAEINDDLLAEGIRLPDSPITPASIGQPDNLLAEEYYAALESQVQQSAPSQCASEQADDTQPGNRGNSSGSKAGNSGGSKPGDGGESSSSSSSGQQSDSSVQPGDSAQPPDSSGSGHGNGQDGRKSGDGAQTPVPGAGRCGSCATGQPEEWEEGPPGEGTSSGISRAEAELIRQDVARQIQEHARSCGNIPGHWARWAEEKLRPKVDWRKELAAMVRHAVADIAGANDYSYRRPSRRQGQVGNGKVVLPSLRRPVPSVAVVVDTSGSISEEMLSQALTEISGILKGLGQREGVHVLACDSQVQTYHRVFRPEQVRLAGGGGTNMGAGLNAAAKLRPTPQVCIIITDGYTPWPDQPPREMQVIVALTDDGKSPKWAKTIRMGGKSCEF